MTKGVEGRLFMVHRIVSGGQTGVDRAALDAAIRIGIDHGGWVPKGRKAEDGRIPGHYSLCETETPNYAERTEKNVLDSDATLIVSRGPLKGGSRLTMILAMRYGKPWLHVDLASVPEHEGVGSVRSWLGANQVGVLNVAGPRAGNDSAIYGLAFDLLLEVLGSGEERQRME